MANKQFTFRTVLGLDSTRFAKGLKSAEAQLNKFKATVMQFAGAMGAGLGFAQMVSKLKETVVELSVAQATLKNTFMNSSAGLSAYGDTNEWLTELSIKYKQEIVSLTDAFAKFHAAADAMNVSLDDQKLVYEALTKAATFFHLSGDRTRDMMVAVEQMFSKGKVTAEELRRQLGNNLPGAFGIMAKAAKDAGLSANGTTAELEDLMKKGLLPANVIMPAFAKRLNEVTKGIDTNSLQLQLNELSNAWTKLAQSSGFEGLFSSLVKTATSALDTIRNHTTFVTGAFITMVTAISSQKIIKSLIKLATATEAYRNAMAAAKTQAEAMGRTTVSAGTKALAMIKGLGAAMKGMMMSNIISAAIMAVGMLISKLVEFVKAAHNARNTYKNFMKEVAEAKAQPHDNAIEMLGSYVSILKDSSKESNIYHDTLDKINEILGLEGDKLLTVKSTWKEINDAVETYAKNIQNNAMAEVLATKIAEAKVQRQQLYQDILNGKGNIRNKTTQYNQLGSAIEVLEAELKGILMHSIKTAPAGTTAKATGGGSGESKDPLLKILEKFTKDYSTLQNKKNSGQVYTGSEGLEQFNQELGQVIKTAGEGIYGFENLDAYLKRLGPSAVKVGNQIKALYTQWKEANKYSESIKVLQDYKKNVEEVTNQYKNGVLTNKEYNTKMDELTVQAYEAIAVFGDLTDVFKRLNPELQSLFSEVQAGYGSAKSNISTDKKNSKFSPKTFSYSRDNRYDFQKSKSERFEGMHDSWSDLASEIQAEIDKVNDKFDTTDEKVKSYLNTLNSQLEVAIANANTLGEAAQLAKWKEVTDELNKEYGQSMYAGIKSTADAIDRLKSGYESLKDVMEDEDSSGLDVFVTTLNETFQLMDTLMSLLEAYNTLQEIRSQVEMANQNKELGMMAQKLALQEALNAALQKQSDLEVAAAASAALNTAASTAEGSAQAGAAVAGAAKSGASLPFPYNLAAIAASVAAVIAALSAMSKFADGGIVGGSSKSGDKILARVNSGEMVLNSGQQSRLWKAINSGNLGYGGGNVTFKIHGSDLVGTLNNYSKQIRG